MYQISLDKYVILLGNLMENNFPFTTKHVTLDDKFDHLRIDYGHDNEVETSILTVQHHNESPFMVVRFWHWPGKEVGSIPGILYVPETDVLFIGAGHRTLAYDLGKKTRLWDQNGSVFFHWRRSANSILRAGDSQLAVWDLAGQEKWSISTYGDLHYRIVDDVIFIEDVDETLEFVLETGPTQRSYGFEPGIFQT